MNMVKICFGAVLVVLSAGLMGCGAVNDTVPLRGGGDHVGGGGSTIQSVWNPDRSPSMPAERAHHAAGRDFHGSLRSGHGHR